jgi:hypothetical protein
LEEVAKTWPQACFDISNAGDDYGTLVSSFIRVDTIPDTGPESEQPWKPIEDECLLVGKFYRIAIGRDRDWASEEISQIVDGEVSVYIRGGVQYRDRNDNTRITCLHRRFNPKTGFFDTVEGSKYEYED